MRRIGSIDDHQEALRFGDYLLTFGIVSDIEEEERGWTVWVHDEDQLERGKEELERFKKDPGDPKYVAAAPTAARIRREEEERKSKALKKQIEVRQRWARPLMKQIPATLVLIVLCVIVALSSNLGKKIEPVVSALTISRVMIDDDMIMWPRGFTNVLQGEVWRLITPIFIHFGPIHLFFNMYWLYILGGLIESRRGHWRYLGLILTLAVASNVIQYVASNHALSGGMSGVGYGLFGYVWMKSRYDPRAGMYIPPNLVVLFIIWFFVCLFGLIANVANWAHGSGLVLGIIIGYAPRLWSRLQKE